MKNADKCSDGDSTFSWLSVHKDRFENGHQKLFGLLLQHLLLVHLVFFCFYMFWGGFGTQNNSATKSSASVQLLLPEAR